MMPALFKRAPSANGLIVVLGAAFALPFFPGPLAILPFVVLAALALRGPGPSLLALAGAWALSALNPVLVPAIDAQAVMIGRYLVLLTVLIATALRWLAECSQGGRVFVSRPSGAAALLTGFLIAHSLAVSSMPELSLLKALLWGLVMCAVLSNWHRLTAAEHAGALQDVERLLHVVLIASAPLLLLPAGFAVNETGFQGLLNHPQLLGVAAALGATFVASRLIEARRLIGWRLALFGFYVYLTVQSESRTALFGLVLALGFAALIQSVWQGSVRQALPLFGSSARVLAGVVIVVALATLAVVSGALRDFVSKSERADVTSVIDAYGVSRGLLVAQMAVNIQQAPLLGIGFGVPSVPEMVELVRDPYFGLPISAPVEKGVMPVAVVEELGVLGAVAILAWLWMGIRRGMRSGFSSVLMLCAVLAMNLGEATLFSVGGVGLLQMLLVGAVYTGRIRAREREVRAMPTNGRRFGRLRSISGNAARLESNHQP
jgi:hypothetical protein